MYYSYPVINAMLQAEAAQQGFVLQNAEEEGMGFILPLGEDNVPIRFWAWQAGPTLEDVRVAMKAKVSIFQYPDQEFITWSGSEIPVAVAEARRILEQCNTLVPIA